MIRKEFEINDILNAVNIISRIEREKGNTKAKKKDFTNNVDILTLNNEVKTNKSEILVLNQMIE